MSYDIEISPSNRTHCSLCDKKILKGEQRLVDVEGNYFMPQKTYFCEDCLEKQLLNMIKYFHSLIQKFIKNKQNTIKK